MKVLYPSARLYDSSEWVGDQCIFQSKDQAVQRTPTRRQPVVRRNKSWRTEAVLVYFDRNDHKLVSSRTQKLQMFYSAIWNTNWGWSLVDSFVFYFSPSLNYHPPHDHGQNCSKLYLLYHASWENGDMQIALSLVLNKAFSVSLFLEMDPSEHFLPNQSRLVHLILWRVNLSCAHLLFFVQLRPGEEQNSFKAIWTHSVRDQSQDAFASIRLNYSQRPHYLIISSMFFVWKERNSNTVWKHTAWFMKITSQWTPPLCEFFNQPFQLDLPNRIIQSTRGFRNPMLPRWSKN